MRIIAFILSLILAVACETGFDRADNTPNNGNNTEQPGEGDNNNGENGEGETPDTPTDPEPEPEPEPEMEPNEGDELTEPVGDEAQTTTETNVVDVPFTITNEVPEDSKPIEEQLSLF